MAVGADLNSQNIARVAKVPITIRNGLRPYLSVKAPPNGITKAAEKLATNTYSKVVPLSNLRILAM